MDANYDHANSSNTEKEIGTMYKIIAARLKNIREHYKMTQIELGRQIGVSGNAISSYEIPYCEIPIDNLRKIANVFNVQMSYFTDMGELINVESFIEQFKICNQYIPYYKHTNTNGILLKDAKIADGCLTLPKVMTQGYNIICTDIPDNSLVNLQYKQGELIFVDTDMRPASGNITLLYDTNQKKMILRKYMCEGPMVTLLADGHGDIPPIYTDITNSEYTVIGPVIRSTRDC